MGVRATLEAGARRTARPRRARVTGAIATATVLACLVAVALAARRGAVAERIRNPAVEGAPRPVEPLFGFHGWLTLHQIGAVLIVVALAVACVIGWRRRPGNPVVLMVLATTLLVWQDPIMNWAPYAVYNPQLWHWPETWPLVSLSPTVEPFIVAGYASFYMAPFFPAARALRRIQARAAAGSFVWRHPLVCLAALILGIGFAFDAALEIFLVRTHLYIYSQVMPLGAVFAGKPHQFPLIWESTLVSTVMIPAGLLLHRDDTGRTQAEKLAQRARFLRSRPTLAAFAVMFLVVNVGYFAYGAGFAAIRASKAATSVACPYPFPEAKVYDPNGFYEKAGQPGPYFEGIWSGWPSGQPSGRPRVAPPVGGGRCAGS